MIQFFMIKSAATHAGATGDVVRSDDSLVDEETIIAPNERYLAAWDDIEGPFGDFLAPLSNPMIVSDRAATIIAKFSLPPGTAFGLVHVQTTLVAGPELCTAKMILFRNPYQELMDQADVEARNRYSFVDRAMGAAPPPIVRVDAVGGFDLLMGLHVMTLCSARLKEAIEDAQLTNCRFLPVAVK